MSGEVIQLQDNKITHWKWALYDAATEMEELSPEVKQEIDARESMIEKICGINPKDLFFFDPATRSKVLMMRRHPDEFVDHERDTILERVANDNNKPLENAA